MADALVHILADGNIHSGQDIASSLGITRMAVWKQLQKLEKIGVPIEAVRGQGYKIPGGVELLESATISASLSPYVRQRISAMQIHSVLESTNSHVAGLGEAGLGVICLAERQTAGRGRRGRQWVSPFGRNIYMSLGWLFNRGASGLEGLSLVVGIALRRALLDAAPDLLLKWPNDLLYKNRKLAGILIEMTGDPSGDCRVVIGIGVNIGMNAGNRPEIDQPWADVREFCDYSRNEVVARIIDELIPVLEDFAVGGFSKFHAEWQMCDVCLGRPVELRTPLETVQGVARGVTESGAIRIETMNGELTYSGGEVSLRLAR